MIPPEVEIWNQTCNCGQKFIGPLDQPCPGCGQFQGGWTHGDPITFDPTQVTSSTNRSKPMPGDPCHTLAKGAQPPAIAFSCKDSGNDAGDLSPTLRSMNFDESHANGGGQVAVAIQEVGKRTGTSTDDTRCGIGIAKEGDPMFTLQAGAQHGVGTRSTVRRLTPRECERLQGFPDDWTAGFSDSMRYRMLGNAVAVPCAEWIFRNLLK